MSVINRNNHDDQQKVEVLAKEIARYLVEQNQVADTLEGIAHWWIHRQRLHEETSRVERAIERLCTQGIVEKRTLPDGKILYSLASRTDKKSH